MAIFSRDGERDSEHRPKITRQFDTHNTVCMDKSSATIRPSASIWMSCVFTGHKISTKQKDRQVATNEQDRIVFQTIRKSCQHLVLSIKMGLVSPQYHMEFDNYFKTTRWKEYLPKSLRQIEARLIKPPPSSSPDLDAETLTKTLSHAQKGEKLEINGSPQSEKEINQKRKWNLQIMTFQITTMSNGPTR